MSREDFRRDLRGAFESISGPSSPSLSARVHEALVDAPERRGGPVWLAGLAVAVIAVILVGILFVAGPLSHRQILPIPGASPSASASPLTTVTPSPSPTDTGPAFVCTGAFQPLAGSAPPSTTAYVDAVRVGTHTGYDRLTIEFKNGQPATVEIRPQGNTTFTQDASGQKVVLQGSKGLLIVIHSADEHTNYSGPTDFKTGYQGLVEARQTGDFEGYVQWGLGTSSMGCYRVFFLPNPDRLVIDVQTN
jgi:hypothetical protein